MANHIATYNGTTGKVIQDSGALVTDFATPASVGTAIGSAAVRYDLAQTLTTTQQAQARTNTGTPAANVIINGDFRINQMGYVSAAVLAAGIYGHDQWKAGAGGGDYSFTQLKSSTQITIAAGKSLIQPIEDVNVAGGSYVLTWTGTAQARAGVNTLTPSGAYAASPLLISGQTAGTVMSIEFNAGTLGTVKLETGALATPFVMRLYDQELLTCQRYLRLIVPEGTGIANTEPNPIFTIRFPGMRAAPIVTATAVITITDIATANYTQAGPNISLITGAADFGLFKIQSFTGLTAGKSYLYYGGGVLKLDARL